MIILTCDGYEYEFPPWVSTTVMHRITKKNKDFQACLFNMKYRNKYKYSAGVRRHSGRFNVQGLQYKQKQLDV